MFFWNLLTTYFWCDVSTGYCFSSRWKLLGAKASANDFIFLVRGVGRDLGYTVEGGFAGYLY